MSDQLPNSPATVEDAMTAALLKGHAMSSLAPDPDLGWNVASCSACGLRLIQYRDGTFAGAALMIACETGRQLRNAQR